eukprot:TRINITY_DN20964_c0_g1_i1.p1 TRINITY_DN20964_c0_g1~~TRINITY_DN20964_c0_g1_i1.p1  ORF type:complete len:435 (+),score=75.68 TRINITY_DN20964_c0_g1_i1:226-1530(+)
MFFLSISPPKFDIKTSIFASSDHYLPKYLYATRVSDSNSANGFLNSPKRVSVARFNLRNNVDLSGCRCEGLNREKDDGFYMKRCVDLAKKALGRTNPNPMVGCVIVKDGEVVGEGFHPKAGQPHAEVFALNDAGILAENATAYVSLEPCNHYGRTPPCTEALIRAKVKRVVVGMVDPNPIVASKGVERLRESGIHVTVGVEEKLCQKLNEAYIHRMLTGKPFVTLRYSLSFNGRILSQLGQGAKESSGYYSQLLQEYNGVIMSSTSFTENFTFLASKETGTNEPLLVIIAKSSNSPICLPTFSTGDATRVIIFADKNTVVDPQTELNLHQNGVELVVSDRINLSLILDYCVHRGLCNVLVDLRGDSGDFGEIIEEGFDGGLLQKVVMDICPVWGGHEEHAGVMLEKSLEKKSRRLRDVETRISKESVVVEGYIC